MTQFNGSKLRELRNEKQLSIAKLSTISDVSTGLISQIERDLVVPSALILFRLAQALETDMYAFLKIHRQKIRLSSEKAATAS